MGSRWNANDVFWHSDPKNGKLLGVPARAKRSPTANFAQQSGIYVLYSDFVPIYVGQANRSLFSRLKDHYLSGDFVGRWDRFTWFGFRKVVGGQKPKLKAPSDTFTISTTQLLDHLEALLIHSFEPQLNGQDGRFGKSVIRYKQVRDDRLGPSDRALWESMAKAGNLVPKGKRITLTGWKDA